MADLRRGNTEIHAPKGVRSRRRVAEAREEQALALRAKGYTIPRIGRELGMAVSSVHEALERALSKRRLLTDEQLIAQKHEHTMMLEHKLEEAVDAWEKSKQDAETERVVEKTLGKPIPGEEDQPHGGSLKRTRREPVTSAGHGREPIRDVLADDAEPGNWNRVDLESIPGYFYNEETGEETLPEERGGIMATWLMEQIQAGRDPAVVQTILERTVTSTTVGQCGDPRYLAEFRHILGEIRKIWGTDAPQKAEVVTRDGDITDEERAARIAAILDRGRERRADSAT